MTVMLSTISRAGLARLLGAFLCADELNIILMYGWEADTRTSALVPEY